MNISSSLLHALKEHGAQEIFGLPGDFVLPFFKVMEEAKILPFYTLSHEPGVGFAADAAARFHSGLGVAAITYGAGAFNMLNAVASAYAEKSRLVVISGAPGIHESHKGLLLHHQAKTLDSQFHIFKEVTCDQVRLDVPAHAPEEIAQVLRSCIRYSRPVYIEIPRDQFLKPCEKVVPLAAEVYDKEALTDCVDDLLTTLKKAQSPMLMVGVEVRRHDVEDQVAEIVCRLNIPVVTSFMGRGLLADTDAPLLGTYMGIAGDEKLTKQVEQSDRLFLLGVILSDTNLGISERHIAKHNMIHIIDEHVKIGFREYSHIPMKALLDELLGRLDEPEVNNVETGSSYPRNLEADSNSIAPLDIAKAVNDFTDKHGLMPMAADVGDCLFTALDMENTLMVAPGYYATMGFGVPAGLGVQAATGKRPLILVGDGAFQMTGWELGNCRRYGWNPIVLLFNNSSWEMLRTFQPESKFNDLDNWPFAKLADNLGGNGIRVTSRLELKGALELAANDESQFYLIEIIFPRSVISPTLERFAKGIKRLQNK